MQKCVHDEFSWFFAMNGAAYRLVFGDQCRWQPSNGVIAAAIAARYRDLIMLSRGWLIIVRQRIWFSRDQRDVMERKRVLHPVLVWTRHWQGVRHVARGIRLVLPPESDFLLSWFQWNCVLSDRSSTRIRNRRLHFNLERNAHYTHFEHFLPLHELLYLFCYLSDHRPAFTTWIRGQSLNDRKRRPRHSNF